MAWQGIEGHDHVVQRFRGRLQSGKLASTFLFVGPAGIGKRSFAQQLARCLHCESNQDEELNILDVIVLISFVLENQEPSEQQLLISDMNDDGMINVLDVIQIVNIILSN